MTKNELNVADGQGLATSVNTINLDGGNFFDEIINLIDSNIKAMEKPFAELELPREFVHIVAHRDFGMSKVMLLEKLERRLNEKYNRIGLYSLWENEGDSYKVLILTKDLLTQRGKEYFNIED